jgi:hypothetical protein
MEKSAVFCWIGKIWPAHVAQFLGAKANPKGWICPTYDSVMLVSPEYDAAPAALYRLHCCAGYIPWTAMA